MKNRNVKSLFFVPALLALSMASSPAAAAPVSIYDFDNGQITNSGGFPGSSLTGQDNWKNGRGSLGVNVRNDLTAATGGHITGNASYSPNNGSGFGEMGRLNDANFSYPSISIPEIALEMTLRFNENNFAHFSLAYDANSDGTIALTAGELGEVAPGFGVIQNGTWFVRAAGLGATTSVPHGITGTQVWKLRYEIDLAANGGNGSGSLFVQQLYDGLSDVSASTSLQPVAGLQNINLAITTGMTGAGTNPANWNGIYLRDNGGPSADNLTMETVPEPGCLALVSIGALGFAAIQRRRRS